ncbi:unnamed protein product [Symbiodinium sp. CCMP2592]|nr:unnamed protein product [Symbiodinium sp. CCMP2592]
MHLLLRRSTTASFMEAVVYRDGDRRKASLAAVAIAAPPTCRCSYPRRDSSMLRHAGCQAAPNRSGVLSACLRCCHIL